MKEKIIFPIIFVGFYINAFSQQNIAFAITGQGKENFNWSDIRSIDMNSGNVNGVLFENGKSKFYFKNAETNQPINLLSLKGVTAPPSLAGIGAKISPLEINLKNPSPTFLTSAAIAYDKQHQKLFFATMHTGQLIWLDLASGKQSPAFYTIDKPLVDKNDPADVALDITRMTMGANGYGYALTNDANHLIRFTTGKKTVVTDLGNLVDAESNKGISVHNQCSSWGGDMVADALGKLYLFTANHLVFEINTDSRIATLKGTLENLPATFSVNGAAVDENENVIVSSANTFDGFFSINMKNLKATKLQTKGQVYNASDLASANFLNQGMAELEKPHFAEGNVIGNDLISIYPNPVPDGQIKISFDNNPTGEYEITITDLQGRLIENKTIYIQYHRQQIDYKLTTKLLRGLYLIKVTNWVNQKLFSDKLIIE